MFRSLLALSCAVPFCCVPVAPTATDEPPLRLTLTIDGAEHNLADGEEIAITVAGKAVRAKATVQPNRRFEGAGVRFDFPRVLRFEHDADIARWKLEGDDCTVLVHVFSSGEPADYAQSVLSQMLQGLDATSAPPQPCEVALGGVAHAGLRGRAHVAATTFEVTTVGVSSGGKPVLLLLRDMLGDDGKTSAEAARILELLKTTFAVAK